MSVKAGFDRAAYFISFSFLSFCHFTYLLQNNTGQYYTWARALSKPFWALQGDQPRTSLLLWFNFNLRTYMQIHTPTVVQGYKGTTGDLTFWRRCKLILGEGVEGPPLEFLICYSIYKRFCLQWKVFDLLYKMRYILWVVALLGACDVTNNGRHLGFYQELEIRLKLIKMVIFRA